MTAQPPKQIKVGLVQMAMTDDPDQNLETACGCIESAANAGANIVCLPELFRTPYLCQQEDPDLFDLAETIPGPTTETLGKLAATTDTAIVASLFERRAPGLYHNTAAVIDRDGRLVGVYRKMHIPDDPGYYEKFYFTPGDRGFVAFDTAYGRIGSLVCWDQWYPEAARLTAMQGATILFYPTAIGWHPSEREAFGAGQLNAWRTIQHSHAIANGVYVAAVNRVGHERPGEDHPGIVFWGSSFLCDPFGQDIAVASDSEEQVVVGRLDLDRLEEIRRNWPFWRDRRVDAYGAITERFLD